MSLRYRLALWIAVIFGLVLISGGALLIQRARKAVVAETTSAAHLTSELLELTLTTARARSPGNLLAALENSLNELSATRHMRVEIFQDGRSMLAKGVPPGSSSSRSVPVWFAYLVGIENVALRRAMSIPGVVNAEIIIAADPGAEVAEVWDESWSLLLLLSGVFGLANALLFAGISRSLRPLDTIRSGLATIEQGNYGVRLGKFRLPEPNGIADKFNHMVATLERSHAENRALTQRSLAIQEQERRHLARELHDELGQALSAIKALAIAITQRSNPNDQEITESARTIAEVATQVYEVVRRRMRKLRPSVLDEFGLITALQEMVEEWNSWHEDVLCTLSVTEDFAELPDDVAIGIYRVVQECLTNVAKHAEAASVAVTLDADAERKNVRLLVRDDGKGFAMRAGNGLGVLGMQERVAALGGTFALDTTPGTGVTVTIEIPLAA